MMIGPSAPNGPPDPIEIADDSGFNSATFASMRLPLIRMASIASGMPCPRMRSDPYRAITPMISAPTIGYDNDEQAEMVADGRGCRGREPPVEEDVREERDQREQRLRDIRRHDADADRDRRNDENAPAGREIAEFMHADADLPL